MKSYLSQIISLIIVLFIYVSNIPFSIGASSTLIGLYPTGYEKNENEDGWLSFAYQSSAISVQSKELLSIDIDALRLRNWRIDGFEIIAGEESIPLTHLKELSKGAPPFFLRCCVTYNGALKQNGKALPFAKQRACSPELLLIPASGVSIQSPTHRRGLNNSVMAINPSGSTDRAGTPPVNLVMLMVDTLRSDHTPPYGHPFVIAPHVDMLTSLGAMFTQSYGASSSTRPSVGSMMTGLQPKAHGAVRHSTQGAALYSGVPLLAEAFQNAGFTTVGISSNAQVTSKFGFARGFDVYECPVWETVVTPKAVKRLKTIKEPFFLYLHYMAPHAPYTPLKPWAGLYDGMTEYKEQDAYCAEISLVDRRLGRVLRQLSELDLLDHTLVWLLSDHGEEFWEHGWKEHGVTLYDESTRTVSIGMYPPVIPMNKRIDLPVTHADLFPTFCDLINLKPPQLLQGKSLLPLLLGKPPGELASRPIFLHHGGGLGPGVHFSDKDGVLLNHKKLIWWNQKDEWELYDLQSDPLEKKNLATSAIDAKREYEGLIHDHVSVCETIAKRYQIPGDGDTAVELSPEEIENLKAFGYIQ